MPETARVARAADRNGALYQQRAIEALPLLVRQASAGNTICYSDLADELGIPNERNLNYELGSVGTSLIDLGNAWGEELPPLQAVVVSKRDGMPGRGFVDSVLRRKQLRRAGKHVQRKLIAQLLNDVYQYLKWPDVLRHFGVKPAPVANVAKLAR